MQPRNSFEQQIEEAGRTLRPISARQIRWAFDRCFVRYGRRTTKGVITCTECGHAWTDKAARTHCICPACHTRLTIDDNHLRRIYDMADYALFMTVRGGMQVLRFVHLTYYVRIGERAKYVHSEVVQRWIAPDGRCATRARLITNRPFYKTWNYTTSLELRPHKPLYNIHPRCVHPQPQLLPELRRSGYNGQFYHISPPEMFCALLRDSRAETLLKAGQVTLLKHFAENPCTLDDYWPSIRIVTRSGYAITDAGMWCDYIDLLRFFNKDLRNAKYVCPADLKAEHDQYVRRKMEYLRKQKEQERIREAMRHEQEYRNAKGHFFGLDLTDGKIHVRVLESIEQFRQEGEAMHHCVFTNEYYRRDDSLILSASIDGQRLETVEVSLSRLEVAQSRGVCNKDSPYHKQIIKLVQHNMHLIENRLTA